MEVISQTCCTWLTDRRKAAVQLSYGALHFIRQTVRPPTCSMDRNVSRVGETFGMGWPHLQNILATIICRELCGWVLKCCGSVWILQLPTSTCDNFPIREIPSMVQKLHHFMSSTCPVSTDWLVLSKLICAPSSGSAIHVISYLYQLNAHSY